jgi:NAD(P)-dependent dehydrogenase (short-subunit alcohol dehydrogenase family)
MLLNDRIAIVSGIGPGMGRDISMALARQGAHIVLAARSEQSLRTVAAEVEALGRRTLCVPTDITKLEDCKNLVRRAHEQFGRIDILCNNAFTPGPRDLIEEADVETWRPLFDINVFGSIRLTKEVIPIMKKQGSGSIIMTNSMSMRIILERYGAYAASKAALLAATQTLAKELGPYGIRVNSIVPGYIWGSRLEGYFQRIADQQGKTPKQVYDEVASQIALRKIPHSEEIVGAVVFFASDLAKVVTGQSLDVNGGHYFH